MSSLATNDPWERLLLSQPLGEYKLATCIGRGGFGYVFEGIHLSTGSKFAVKVLNPSSAANADNLVDFKNEGDLLRRLKSCDGIVDYVEGGTQTFQLQAAGIQVPIPIRFHVLAIASGSADELTSNPETRNSLDWTARLRLWRDVVVAVHQMHHHDIVHRDLKAENCLLMVRGNTTRVRLADFGRAKDISTPPSRLPENYLHGRGDMRFAPPEFLLLQGDSSADDFISADYYGLGSLLVEIACGQPMSALALGDWGSVVRMAQEDMALGMRRNLAGLASLFASAIADIVSDVPPSIREDTKILLDRLCHPVPIKRLEGSPFVRDRLARNPLDWVIRRVDIMIKRLQIEARDERRNRKVPA